MKKKDDAILKVPVIHVETPCEECHKPGNPDMNLQYSLVGMTGVLCRSCMNVVLQQINAALEATKHDQEQEQEQEQEQKASAATMDGWMDG